MLLELDNHPHARAILTPVLAAESIASHAYLFHGPGGAGKRAAARSLAASLLEAGAADPDGARARVMSGTHPDLTWVAPSGAHEILVSDIDAPVVASASKTPFEASRRVFVIERVDELGDEAANRMLKTLEEPASFVHLILLTDRLGEVLPTIRSRCQLVRFDAPSVAQIAGRLEQQGVSAETAAACARLALGDADRAQELAAEDGARLRAAGEEFARAAVAGEVSARSPWGGLLAAVRARGEATRIELEARAADEMELYPSKERRRVENEWSERIRRARRRSETRALDLGLQLVSLWFADLAYLAWEGDDLVRNVDRMDALVADTRADSARVQRSIDLVEETRMRFQLNVSEDLACEALAYRLEHVLAS